MANKRNDRDDENQTEHRETQNNQTDPQNDEEGENPVRTQRADSDVQPEDVIAGARDEDPVSRACARTGRADTSGVNGIPASDEDAGEERRKLYEQGATLVSRID